MCQRSLQRKLDANSSACVAEPSLRSSALKESSNIEQELTMQDAVAVAGAGGQTRAVPQQRHKRRDSVDLPVQSCAPFCSEPPQPAPGREVSDADDLEAAFAVAAAEKKQRCFASKALQCVRPSAQP